MKRFFPERLLDLIFPPKCAACGEILTAGKGALCGDCRARWEHAKYRRCPSCGLHYCRCRCATSEMYREGIREAAKLVPYESGGSTVANRVVFALKRDNDRRLVAALARECAAVLDELLSVRGIEPGGALITYPGRTARARREAGYDHARAVAREISRLTGIPFAETLVRRGGVPQKKLSTEERRKNAGSSLFAARELVLHGESVVVFDDVVTTGATMARAAALLREHGAGEVLALSVARTVRSREEDENAALRRKN